MTALTMQYLPLVNVWNIPHKEGPELEWLFFHQYIMPEGWGMGSVTRATECTQEFSH